MAQMLANLTIYLSRFTLLPHLSVKHSCPRFSSVKRGTLEYNAGPLARVLADFEHHKLNNGSQGCAGILRITT